MNNTLADVRDSYILSRNVCEGYALHLHYSITRLERYLGRVSTVPDLNPDTINRWLKVDEEAGTIVPRTLKGYRGSILTLWNFAYEERHTEIAPKRIRKIKVARKAPTAWTAEQIRRLLEVAGELTGRYQRSRVPRAAFWRAWILTNWDTGLRRGDLRALATADVRGLDAFTVTQHKTGIPIVCRLRQETVEAIEATYPPNRPLVFGGVLSTVKVGTGLKSLAQKAGLPTHDGVTRMLRRSAATALEMVTPGAAMRFLGHATPGLAHKHYIDAVILGAAGACPPSLLSVGLDGAIMPATEVPSLGAIQELLERAIVSAKVKDTVITIPPSDIRPAGLSLPSPSLEIMPLVDEFLSGYSHRQKNKWRSLIRSALEGSSVWTVADLPYFCFTEHFAGVTSSARICRQMCVAFLRWLARNNDAASDAAAACLGRAYIAGYPTTLQKRKDGAE